MSESPSSSVQISKRSRSSSPPATKVAHKRKRQTLSCLQCKKRKTKCDKARPCSTCIARQEGDMCEYDDGASPPPQSAYVHIDQFLELQHRLETLEARFNRPGSSSNPSPFTKLTTGSTSTGLIMEDDGNSFNEHVLTPHPLDRMFSVTNEAQRQRQKIDDVEQAFSAVEGLAHTLVSDAAIPGPPPGFNHDQHRINFDASGGRPPPSGQWTTIMSQGPLFANRSPKWVRDMKEVLSVIPEPELIHRFLTFFFSELYPSRPQVHEGIFRQEVAQFNAVRNTPDNINVDPGWLVLLISMLWVSSHSLLDEAEDSQHIAAVGLSKNQLKGITLELFEQLEAACNCARWLCLPQMRILYALLIGMPFKGRGPFTSFHGSWNWDRASSTCMWFDVCIAISKKLGLHRLGPENDPRPLPDDPMLPKSLPTYSRQIAARAFHNIKLYDTCTFCSYLGMSIQPPSLHVADGSWDTAEPGNFTDESLLEPNPTPKGMNELTPIVFQLHKLRIAPHWRAIVEQSPATSTYDKVLVLDANLRRDLDCVMSLKLYHNLEGKDNLNFWITCSSYQQRLIRLHRPYYAQAFSDQKYSFSRSTALSAARQITQSHRNIISKYGPLALVRDSLYLFTHHLSAVIVMFLEALYNPVNLEEMKRELQQSSDILRQAGSDGKRVFAGVGYRGHLAVVAMLRILENPPDQIESVTALLKEIEGIANSNVTLPPPNNATSMDGQSNPPFLNTTDPMQSAAQYLLGQALQPSSVVPIPLANDPLAFNFDLGAGWTFPSEEFGVLPDGKPYDFTFDGMFAGL